MNWLTRGLRVSGLAGALVLLLAGAARVAAQDAPVRNLRIPLDHFEDGRVKTQITAATASIAPNGSVKAEGVKVEMYGPDGSVTGVVDADACFVDRETGMVTSTSPVHFVQQGISISGVGFEWNMEARSVTILAQARVEFARDTAKTVIKKN